MHVNAGFAPVSNAIGVTTCDGEDDEKMYETTAKKKHDRSKKNEIE